MKIKNEKEHFDCLIVGAGPVGLSAAIALASKNFSVAVIDKVDLVKVLRADFDGRTTAISYGTKLLMGEWGIWSLIEKDVEPILEIITTANDRQGTMTYGPEQSNGHPMGFIIENHKLRAALIQRALETNGVRLLTPHEIQSHEKGIRSYTITLDNGHQIETPLVIAADGKKSLLRGWVDIKARELPYHQTALVFVASHEKPHQGQAFEHFRSSGPLAFLPMKGNRSSVVWSLETKISDTMKALETDAFEEELNIAFGKTLGTIKLDGPLWSYPLSAMVMPRYGDERLIFIGDAAHTMHPVAGQGFNVGARDAGCLAKHLKEARDLGLDWGSLTTLQAYERDRKVDVHSMTGFTDLLVRYFSSNSRIRQSLGGFGLSLMDRLPPLKNILARHAMGMGSLENRQ